MINHAAIKRIQRAGRGGARVQEATTSDYQKVDKITIEEIRGVRGYSDEELNGMGLVRNKGGLIKSNIGEPIILPAQLLLS